MKLLVLLLGLLLLTSPVVAQQPQQLFHFTVSIAASEQLTPIVRSYATRALRSIPDIRIDTPADYETDYKLALSVLEIKKGGDVYGYAVHHYFASFGVKHNLIEHILRVIKDINQCTTKGGGPLTDLFDIYELAGTDHSISIFDDSAYMQTIDKDSLEDVIRTYVAEFDGEYLELARRAYETIMKAIENQ